MKLSEVLTALQEPDANDCLKIEWDKAMRAMPSSIPSFLLPGEFKTSREWAGFGPELDALLESGAARIRENPALMCLTWYYHWRTFDCADESLIDAPALEKCLGEWAGLPFLLIALSWIPKLRAYHRILGVPENVTRETGLQVSSYCSNYQRSHGGHYGIMTRQMRWLRNYVGKNLYFRIGRMEYWFKEFDGELEVYRHIENSKVVALMAGGLAFGADGFRDVSKGTDPGAWTSTLEKTDREARGHPVLPAGKVSLQPATLPLAEWKCVLKKGDGILDMHIPAGGNMTLEKCGDSMRRAVEFFRQYFPDKKPSAFLCKSWMFSPCLEEILPPSANLVKYMRELYLYPNEGVDRTLWFVFLQNQFDPATAPRETSLQRAVYDYVTSGHLWRTGNMFFLTDDLPHFGTGFYRGNFPAGLV
ncbi:MAG: hypothetical protein PHV34_05695 [Verrucomicrobiae bacterium]|nr:hypothetical protein [Verrucomicrobiae bacterium]